MGNITELLRARQFQTGLVDGVFALAFVLLCGATRLFGRRPPVAGAAFAFAGLAALTGTGPGRRALDGVGIAAVLGVVFLLCGGALSRLIPAIVRLLVVPLLLLPGAVVLGLAARHHGVPWWSAVLLIVVLPPSGALAADLDDHHARRAYGPILLVITVAGVYLTVPDTEGARALLGVALPLVLLTVPRAAATLGPGGAAAAVGLIGYDVVLEGVARPGSVIGALGCLGLFLYEPIGRRVLVRMRERDGHGPSDHLRNVLIAASLQALVVLWAARVAGREDRAVVALLLLLPAVACGIIATPLLPDPPLPGRTPVNR